MSRIIKLTQRTRYHYIGGERSMHSVIFAEQYANTNETIDDVPNEATLLPEESAGATEGLEQEPVLRHISMDG